MFETLRDELAQHPAPPAFFFRDDDADQDIAPLRRLLEIFGERHAPLSLAVIPGTLTVDAARLLRETAREPWLGLHQHGWRHVNHEPTGRKCEFGPSRPYAEQYADIARGQARLLEMLGPSSAPVFTPPWNRCTSDTCRALTELGFAALSKDNSSRLGATPAEMSIAVDIFTWKSGPQLKTAAQIAGEIRRAASRPEPLGVLLHHKVMTGEAFALVAALLDHLRPAAPFLLLEESSCASRN